MRRECLQQGTLEIRLGPRLPQLEEEDREHLRAVGRLPCCQARAEDLRLGVAEHPGVKIVGSGGGS